MVKLPLGYPDTDVQSGFGILDLELKKEAWAIDLEGISVMGMDQGVQVEEKQPPVKPHAF